MQSSHFESDPEHFKENHLKGCNESGMQEGASHGATKLVLGDWQQLFQALDRHVPALAGGTKD